MLQDNLRSAVYRSLVKTLPIDHENGDETTEFGTNTKSKTSHPLEANPIGRRSRRGFGCALIGDEEEKAMGYKEKSEFQLLEVSRGAHELTHMIDSWSNAPNLAGRSKYIAEDLLRGSLDLQESLVMLSKLQDASKRMSHLKMRQRSDFMEKRDEVNDAEAMGESKRFEMRSYPNRLQESRHSVDGLSRNCIEELRKVIKDSLHRQNLLSVSSDDENGSSIQSLRSSKNSKFDDRSYEWKEKIVSSNTVASQPKKAKAPNLVAKLMGLEEIPLETVQPIKGEVERKKISKVYRHTFDIEMPKASKRQLAELGPDPKQKTLKQIIETMQFKGLLKNGQVEDFTNNLHFSNTSELMQHDRDFSEDDQAPPIVIMKPLCLPLLEREEVQKELSLEKIFVQEEIHSVKLIQEEEFSDHRQVLPRTSGKGEVKPKRMEKAKFGSPRQQVNTLSTVSQKQQRKETSKMQKKPQEAQKPLVSKKKLEEKKDGKTKRVPISQPKTTHALQTNPDERLDTTKKSVTPVKPVSKNSTNPAKKKALGAKPIRKSIIIKAAIDSKKFDDGKANNPLCEPDAMSTTKSTLPFDDPHKETKQETKPWSRDDTKKEQKILREVMPKASQVDKSSGLTDEVIQVPDKKTATVKSPVVEDDIKHLLLGSQFFLSYAEELFDIDAHLPIYRQRKCLEEDVTTNAKLFLDFGKELMARRKDQHRLLNHPMLHNLIYSTTVSLSVDQLVEEISDGIKKLTIYNKIGDHVSSEDSLYSRLERDLLCKEMLVNAIWDVGWVTMVCIEEADEVVGEVEENVLSLLIEEVAIDLVC